MSDIAEAPEGWPGSRAAQGWRDPADWREAARVRLDLLDAAITRYGEAVKDESQSLVAARADVCEAIMDLCEKVASAGSALPPVSRPEEPSDAELAGIYWDAYNDTGGLNELPKQVAGRRAVWRARAGPPKLIGGEGPAIPAGQYYEALHGAGCIEIPARDGSDMLVFDITTGDGLSAAIAELTAWAGPPGEPSGHPEDFCHRCGRPNVVWFASNDLWSQAVPDGGILCPSCFIQAAEAAGIRGRIWRVTPENATATSNEVAACSAGALTVTTERSSNPHLNLADIGTRNAPESTSEEVPDSSNRLLSAQVRVVGGTATP